MQTVKAFLLTALICVNLFGFYAMFIFKQAEIKTEMSEKISMVSSSTQHETLTYTEAEFSQLVFNDNNKELRVNGRLYDVVQIEKSGSQVHITVEYDQQETELIETFGNLLGQQQDKDQSSSPFKTIITHFQQDYIALYQLFYNFQKASLTRYCVINNSYPPSSFLADNLTPPPQFFLV